MKINPIIDRIANELATQIKILDHIEGIVFFGSYGRKTHDLFSDLDMFIYLNEKAIYEECKNDLKQIIIKMLKNNEEGVSYDFEIDDKWIVFTEKSFIKLEIWIKYINKAKQDVIYIIETRIATPSQVIAFDRNNEIHRIYSENWINLNDNSRLKDLFLEESHKFIYYFNNALSNLAKDDEYRAYMNYTIAFYKLVDLKAMVEGEYFNLYQPKHFTSQIINDEELKVKYYNAAAGLRKYDMINQRDNLKSLFLDVLIKGIERFKLDKDILVKFQNFFTNVYHKYAPFKNFRDISLLPNAFSNGIRIKEGVIYRSASLSKNDPELILKFIKEKGVKYIIDLRGKKELENYFKADNFYDTKIKEKYIINIPIEPEVNIYFPEKPTENFYYAMLKDYREEIKLIFENYIVNAPVDNLIIHCEGGKDRTGIIIAILLDLLHIPREIIIGDYLLSYSDTKREYLEFLLNVLDNEYGGSEKFLISFCNISENSIQKIKNDLVEKS